MPTTVDTAVEGNMSPGVEKMLALQPWWAAVARQNRPMAGQGLVGKRWPMYGTKTIGTTQTAQMSIATLRPRLTLEPRFIRKPESQPPAIEPMLATVYMTISGYLTWLRPRP